MAATGTKTFQNLIGGEWVDAVSGETFESRSPATGEAIGVFPKSGPDDVARAVEAAQAAYEDWRLVPAPKRGEILIRFAQILGRTLFGFTLGWHGSSLIERGGLIGPERAAPVTDRP